MAQNRSRVEVYGNRIPVFHFVGAGRSGTTLLNSILGNHPDVMSVGEVAFIPSELWVHEGKCACGQDGYHCPFWSKVRGDWYANTELTAACDYVAIQRRYERYRRLPRLLNPYIEQSPEFLEYARHTTQLYASIQRISRKRIIADSSKNPVRALAVSHMPGINLRLIFMTRDVRAVVWSNCRSDGSSSVRSIVRHALHWRYINWLAERVTDRIGGATYVRYEDLVRSPENSLEALGEALQINMADVIHMLSGGDLLNTGHLGAGNRRMRMNSSVALRADTKWQTEMPAVKKALVWRLAAGPMRRYGYEE